MNYTTQVVARIVMFCIGFAVGLAFISGERPDPAGAVAVGVLGGVIGVVAGNRWIIRDPGNRKDTK